MAALSRAESELPEGLPPSVQTVVRAVRASRKYRTLDVHLVAALAQQELDKGRSVKAAAKAVKNRLHQSAAAYLAPRMEYAAWLDQMAQAYQSGDGPGWRAALRRVMGAHTSTRERLPILDLFYPALFQALPPVTSILDLACGLNPLAIPWMGLAPTTTYLACDLFQDQIDFLNRFLALVEVPGQAFVCDVIHQPPSQPVDVALVLKVLPCLERLEPTAPRQVLASLQARHVVISFPVHSLGGRVKGMPRHYRDRLPDMLPVGWRVRWEREFASELVFVVEQA